MTALLTATESQIRQLFTQFAGEEVGCVPHNVGTGMIDRIKCDCGWESRPYFDGYEYAFECWREHIRAQGAIISFGL